MATFNTVVKGLECCIISMDDDNPFEKCDVCPYHEESVCVQDCRSVLSQDTLELIRSIHPCANCPLDPVKPTWNQGKAYCGACGKRIPQKINARFCHKCGREIAWT